MTSVIAAAEQAEYAQSLYSCWELYCAGINLADTYKILRLRDKLAGDLVEQQKHSG